jgi:predicted nucleotidyltransferase
MAARYHPNGLRVIDAELIDEVVQTIVQALRPKRIVLFGSHARGDAGPDSDLDLMIEMKTDLPFLERSLVVDRLFRGRLWALDAVVYTPAEVQRDVERAGTLLSMIEREARTLYEQQPRVRA